MKDNGYLSNYLYERIRVSDSKVFHTEAEVLNLCFGKNYISWEQGTCVLDPTHFVWFPIMEQKEWKEWQNVLSDNGKEIIETYIGSSDDDFKDLSQFERYTFGRYKDGYHFLGVFKTVSQQSEPIQRVHRQISEEIDLYRFLAEKEVNNFDTLIDKEDITKLPMEELRNRAEKKPETTIFKLSKPGMVRLRNPYVSTYAKRRANGRCQLCGEEAPFTYKKGFPFLECHHIEWLAQGGEDTLWNTVALCPNCHRKMHVIKDPEDVKKLHRAVEESEKELHKSNEGK